MHSRFGSLIRKRAEELSRQMSAALLVLTALIFLCFLLTVPENRLMLKWLAVICIACATGTLLARRGFNQFNQFLLSTGLSAALLFSTIQSKLVNTDLIHEGSYFNPRFFLIGLCFIPFVVFDLKRQRWQLWAGAGLNIAFLLFYIPIHRLFQADPLTVLGHDLKNNLFITVASSSAAIAISVGMFFLKRANSRYEEHIEGLVERTTQQHEELESSIRYARTLQETVISRPDDASLRHIEWSVFERPRNTVSGDFFLLEARGANTYATLVDCTGHGVPGAFVSLMACNGIRRAMDRDSRGNPAEILNSLQEEMGSPLEHGQGGLRDGMDMVMCRIDHEKQTLTYASALGLGYLVHGEDLTRLEKDRRSIDGSNAEAFNAYELSYQPGDLLVLMSDGYKDQFGGDRFRKLSRRRLEGLLREISSLPVQQGRDRLKRVFEHWKGDQEQTDDVCVLILQLS